MMNKLLYIIPFILLPIIGLSQSQPYELGHWTLTSMSGEVNVNGLYRTQQRTLGSGVVDYPKNSLLAGGIFLKTKSYFWHPSFITLGLDLDYNPERIYDSYITVPDQSEVRNLKNLRINLTFFNRKVVSFSTFMDISENIRSIESLNNIETRSEKYGGSLTFQNKIAPVLISGFHHNWEQKEHSQGRIYKYIQNNIESRANRTEANGNSTELSYSINDHTREDANLFKVHNTISNFNLNNFIFFDNQKKYSLNSRIYNFSQQGDQVYNKFQIIENLATKLPHNFRLVTNYNYTNSYQPVSQYDQNSIKSRLNHQLFLSLKSSLFYEYNTQKGNEYKETNNKIGFDIAYSKKIPLGNLNVSYKYFTHIQSTETITKTLNVTNEELVLSDQEITLMKNPEILIESIVVTDLSGTEIYQLNLDYILLPRNNYIEIQRLSGGQIPNGATVYINYTAELSNSYNYKAQNRSLNISVTYFKRLIEIYYRNNHQDFNNLENTTFIALNYYSQNIIGTRITKGPFGIGYEYDYYKSSIIPYKLNRAYTQFQGNWGEKFLYSLIGNVRDYYMINEDRKQLFIDVTGKFAYKINRLIKLNIDLGYRNQKGEGIDLNLFTNRFEMITQYKQLYFNFGVELYQREYLSEKISYLGTDFKIARKF